MTGVINKLKRKRGIVLLVVLSLLALFVLLGITFAIVANMYVRSSEPMQRIEQIGDPLSTETDLVLGPLIHDTLDRSSLQGHSLLMDLYGSDSAAGVISPASNPFPYDNQPIGGSVGQLWRFWTLPAAGSPLSTVPHYYAGRVITFIDGPGQNHSSRIVDSTFDPRSDANHQFEFVIEAIESKRSSFAMPLRGSSFIINGAPFNGAGAGYDPITGNLDAVLVNQVAIQNALSQTPPAAVTANQFDLVALLPHFAGYDMSPLMISPGNQRPMNQIVLDPRTPFDTTGGLQHPSNKVRSASSFAMGGLDESHDTPDQQNMAMAMLPPRLAASLANNNLADATTYNDDLPIIPSFHRPELINFWINYIRTNILEASNHQIMRTPMLGNSNSGFIRQMQIIAFPYGFDGIRGNADDPQDGTPEPLRIDERDRIYNIMRGCIFRPMPWDHPNFTGSNPNFAPTSPTDAARLFDNLVNSPNPPLDPNYDINYNPTASPIRPPFSPGFAALAYDYYPNRPVWDVDNDADGIPDSIWIDPGLPIITTRSGRRLKRLAAILVKDLDGSIDLNAHGNLLQGLDVNRAEIALNTLTNNIAPLYRPLPQDTLWNTPAYALGLAPATIVPRGIGFGPAEVDFLNILGGDRLAYGNLLFGRYESLHVVQSPDRGINARPGAYVGNNSVRDPWSFLQHYGIPDSYGTLPQQSGTQPPYRSWYASPPDVWGRGVVVLDVGGPPIWANTAGNGEMLDSPYEMIQSGMASHADWRYTPGELERLLRYHDVDAANLPDRLLRLGGTALAPGYQAFPYYTANGSEPPGIITQATVSNTRRNMLTTVTSSIPSPATAIPQELRTYMASLPDPKTVGTASIIDLYYEQLRFARYRAGRGPDGGWGVAGVDDNNDGKIDNELEAGTLGSDDQQRPAPFSGIIGTYPLVLPEHLQLKLDMEAIVPWEFFKGQKMDLNRWLGNGFDENNNGAVDDSAEAGNESVWPVLPTPPFPNGSIYAGRPGNQSNSVNVDGTADNNNNATVAAPDAQLARQLYARHLYCLALLLGGDKFTTNASYSFPHQQGITNANHKSLLLRMRLAQWAINCADFRDADAIMTPFEFDLDPFTDNDQNPNNGTWDVDGWIGRSPGPDGQFFVGDDFPSPDDDETVATWRRVVWGMEYPDLLMTETLGLHDRRVKDTDKASTASTTDKKRTDPSPSQPDEDLDQFRVSQGSLFIELYCTRGRVWQTGGANDPNQQRNQKQLLPGELYDNNGRLEMGKQAPAKPGSLPGNPRGQRPVWRIALSKVYENNTDPNAVGERGGFEIARSNQETASFNPTDVNLLPGAGPDNGPLAVDRFVYFGPLFADNGMNGGASPREIAHSFSNSNLGTFPALLPPGGYAIVGPRAVTHLGSQGGADDAEPAVQPVAALTSMWGGNSRSLIQIDPQQITVRDTTGRLTSRDGTPITGVRAPIGIVADTNLPSDWTGTHNWRVGMNVTEPIPFNTLPVSATGTNYYPEPTAPVDDTKTGGVKDFYDDPDVPLNDGTGFKDVPLDSRNQPTDSWQGRPIAENDMNSTGTYGDCATAFLQRLANPTIPYNPLPNTDPFVAFDENLPPNPYINVDWASIDVTVFTGEENTNRQVPSTPPGPNAGQALDPDDENPYTTAPEEHFRTRQRGFFVDPNDASAAAPTLTSANPWPPLTFNGSGSILDKSEPGSEVGPFFKFNLSNDLYLPLTATTPQPVRPYGQRQNPPYQYPYDLGYTGTTTPADKFDLHTLGYLNEPINHLLVQEHPGDQGTNYQPPYMTEYMVYAGEPAKPFPWLNWNNRPFSNAMELLLVPTSSSSRVCSEFVAGPAASASPGNLLGTSLTDDVYGTSSHPNSFRAPFGHLYSFFTTSNFTPAAGQLQLPPAQLQTRAASAPNLYRLLEYVEVPSPFAGTEKWYNPSQLYIGYPYTPPFTGGFYQPPFNKLSRFRDPGKININTIFDQDVWNAAVAQFPLMQGNGTPTDLPSRVFTTRQGYSPLLEMHPLVPTRFGNPFRTADSADFMPNLPPPPANPTAQPTMRQHKPVEATFMRSADPNATPPIPLFDNPTSADYDNAARNPYFRFQRYQKIGNLFTTQSNCYAVWITIGYFELEDNIPTGQTTVVVDAAHPDGLRLGQEAGAEGGEISRQRAFYIIDRSIPVGFQPGRRLNTDDCILLRRLIE